MWNPYLCQELRQSNAELVEKLKAIKEVNLLGVDLIALVAIKETLFMERRLSGDTQRDMAQRIELLLSEVVNP